MDARVEVAEISQDGCAAQISEKDLAHPHPADENSEGPTHSTDNAGFRCAHGRGRSIYLCGGI
jgi:hypothetical protein